MDERTTIDVILVEPGEEAKMITMGDNLEAMQGIVDQSDAKPERK